MGPMIERSREARKKREKKKSLRGGLLAYGCKGDQILTPKQKNQWVPGVSDGKKCRGMESGRVGTGMPIKRDYMRADAPGDALSPKGRKKQRL